VCLDPKLGGFFFVKLYLEILEGISPISLGMTGLSPSQVLHEAGRAWIDIYWRGIALYPRAPIPTLPGSEESF
jgi:hypothetical protein